MSDSPKPPERPFDPFVPSAADPFDTRRLCHLLRRTSFGVTPARIESNKDKKPGDVVNALLDYDVDDDPFDSMLDNLEGFVNLTQAQAVASYWFYRMLN